MTREHKARGTVVVDGVRSLLAGLLLVGSSVAVGAELPKSLADAIVAGDVAAVQAALEATPTFVDARDDEGRTLLHVAAREGQTEVAEVLLERGAEVGARDEEGQTPLLLAVRKGSLETVDLLLRKDAVPTGEDLRAAILWDRWPVVDVLAGRLGELDIFMASALGQIERVRTLLAADPALARARDAEFCGEVPLDWAAATGQTEVARFLIENGADANSGRGGLTPLCWAVWKGRRETAAFLIGQGAAVEPPVLHLAAHMGRTELVEDLLKAGAKAGATVRSDRDTPLHWAAEGGHAEVARLLLAHSADPNAKAVWPVPVSWWYGADQGSPVCLALIAQWGSRWRNHPGESEGGLLAASTVHVLHEEYGKSEVDDLLFASARLAVLDEVGWAPLHWAALNDRTEVAEVLLASGAEVNVKSPYSATPLHLAVMRGDGAMVSLLLAKGADAGAATFFGAPLHEAVRDDRIEICTLLLDKGADPNAVDSRGRTPLHLAGFHGRAAFAELLIARGADVNLRDKDGKTPLALAIARHHADAAEALRQHGAKE